ncbi:MAG: S-layer homology domain-containing protein [Oscillospiraceae bacterium]|jgi:hypothetical protein|nr:S-layer homology domain-containing protein [Oscillospiraceae bacterium]
MKKLITAILCAAMILAAFAGCAERASGYPGYAADEYGGIDYEAAFGAFAPDTVMMNIGGYKVTWEELFFFLYGVIYDLSYYGDGFTDWNDTVYTGETYAEAVLKYSIDSATRYKAVEYGADKAGISISSEDLESMQRDYNQAVLEYGNEEEFLKSLWEYNGCRSRSLYDYIIKVNYLASNYSKATYGESGELLSDKTVAEYTEQDGYLMAKHILRLKPEDGDNTPLQEIEDILKQLKSYKGNDFDGFFDQLMFENSEDTGGLAPFPDGYLFQYNDMVEPFSKACAALKTGEYSGIVESEFGYHIIYRIPINYDIVPLAYANARETTTLRHIVALGMFNETIDEWISSLNVENTPALDSMNIAAVFKIGSGAGAERPPQAELDAENHFAYMIGYEDNTVRPQKNITRAEAATIFFRLLTQESRENLWSATNSFLDVSSANWYNDAVSTLTNGGILNGYPDGTFRPNATITRAEFAAIVVRFIFDGDIGTFPDAPAPFSDTDGHWAEGGIKIAAALGYVDGYPDGSFRPNAPITRAEAAALINNALNRHTESEEDMLDDMLTWGDNQPGAWYYFDIQEATNSHYYERNGDSIFENWTELIKNPD